MSNILVQQIAVERLGDGQYVSRLLPMKMGNPLPIAYGGCTMAVAVNAACASVPTSFSLYSVLGHFLGPASTEEKLYCTVENTRNTRSFATRRVQVKQKQPDGSFRTCLELLADFHVAEPAVLTYSAIPNSTFPKPEDCPSVEKHLETLLARGVVTKGQIEGFSRTLGISGQYLDTRYCTDGVVSQNLSGIAKTLATTQDHRHITAKTSSEWQRSKTLIESKNANFAALAFLMDAGLAFLPLAHNHLWFEDVGACSSLDFALRIFTSDIQLGEWHLRERTTSRGGDGRTYSEGRLWDREGNLVASMTQQSILRVKPKHASSKM